MKKTKTAKKSTKTTSSFLKRVSKPPQYAKKDFHHWADYIELLCLINQDGICSRNDFIDRIKNPSSDLEDSEDFSKVKKNIEVNESLDLFAEDCFKVLEYRANSFQEYYPYTLSPDKKNIELTTTITRKNRIYLFLLCSSSIGYFLEFKPQLTSSFEKLSYAALTNLLPSPNSKKHLFGSSNIENEKENESLFWDKLQNLATKLKETVIIKKDDISKYHKGDGGLDIVGWIELGDTNRHFPMFFCQCACTPKWIEKQNSSQYNRWSNFITLSTFPINFIFIPYSFRSANGEWHEEYLIEKSILMDRLRLVHNFSPFEEEFEKFESLLVIEKILQKKESIV